MKRLLSIFLFLLLAFQVEGQSIIRAHNFARAQTIIAGGATYTDDFESYGTFAFGTEETLTGKGLWIAGATGKAQILGNDGAGDDYISADLNGGHGTLIYNDVFADNQYSQIVLDVVGATDLMGVGVRLSGSGATLDGYTMIAYNAVTRIYRIDDGVYTELNAYIAARSNDDVLKLTISGTTLMGYINDVAIDWDSGGVTEITDATYASGQAGISGYHWSNTTIGDDWEGGDL